MLSWWFVLISLIKLKDYFCNFFKINYKVNLSSESITNQMPPFFTRRKYFSCRGRLHVCAQQICGRLSCHKPPEKVPLSLTSLTKEGVGEPVPLAAVLAYEPSAVQAGGEAEGGPEHAHEEVAHADVQQDQINRRPEGAELCEDEQCD